MSLLDRVREYLNGGVSPHPSAAYREAMDVTDELLNKFRSDEASHDPVVALMSSIWANRHNVPYTVTIFEADQEMRAATFNDKKRTTES